MQLYATLIVAGQPGNHTVLATAIGVYQAALEGSADASLLAPIPEALLIHVIPAE